MSGPEYWDKLTDKFPAGEPFDELLAEHYRRSYLRLIKKWAADASGRFILKTDMYDEALCQRRSYIADICDINDALFSIDISPEIAVRAAKNRLIDHPSLKAYLGADVRYLPFKGGTFDLAVSDSTLDHFPSKRGIHNSLEELYRVLKPGGKLIITLDNKHNLTNPLFQLWIKMGLAPFFIGKTLSQDELKSELKSLGFIIEDEAAIIHVPRFFGKLLVKSLRRIHQHKFNAFIVSLLDLLDRLEERKIRYLTAQFIACKATKPGLKGVL